MAAVFATRRERRLWAWTLVVVVAIYSTLGLARTLAAAVGPDALGAVLFVTGMLLVVGAVVLQAWRARPGGVEIGVGAGVAAAYLLVFVRMASPVERSHLIEYGVVALFVHEALLERVSAGRRVPRPAFVAIGVTALLGAVDEALQIVLPGRVFDPVDIVFNLVAAALAVTASVGLRWARRRRRPEARDHRG